MASGTTPPRHLGPCFACNQEGHWVRDCPTKTTPRPKRQTILPFYFKRKGNGSRKIFKWHGDVFPKKQCIPSVDASGSSHPFCPCGAGWCLRLTMESGPNAGRKYFACPARVKKCEYLRWCDVETEGPSKRNLTLAYPTCPCGAGKCRLFVTMEDLGHAYFACPILKGQGACGFFQWLEPPEDDTSVDHVQLPEITSPILTNVMPTNATITTNRELRSGLDQAMDQDLSFHTPIRINTTADPEVKSDLDQAMDQDRSFRTPIRNTTADPEVRSDLDQAMDQDLSFHTPTRNNTELVGISVGEISTPLNCYSCGGVGHVIYNCPRTPSPPSYRYSAVGHQKKDCTAQEPK